jgi:hypothetical protein
MKKAYKYLIFIIVIALAVGVVIGLSFFQKKNIGGNVVSISAEVKPSSNSNSQMVVITQNNLGDFLQTQQLIKDIPENGIFILKLYNFDTGTRQIENSYILKKGSVVKGDEKADVIIYLHSKYISQIGDLCSAMRSAKKNGDLGYETSMSELSFMWKYKSLMKYKSCFGL